MNNRDKYEIQIDYKNKQVVCMLGRRIMVESFECKSSINDAVDKIVNKISESNDD
jgi:hypothetical protein